jgi:hypothetical protein
MDPVEHLRSAFTAAVQRDCVTTDLGDGRFEVGMGLPPLHTLVLGLAARLHAATALSDADLAALAADLDRLKPASS